MTRNRAALTVALAFSALTASAVGGSVIYVDAGAGPGGDGSTWVLAHQSLHVGLAEALPGDSVWVAEGTYEPAPAGGSRDATFLVTDDVAVYGGFAGDETSPDQRDVNAHQTFLSGDLDGDDGPAFAGTDDNSRHVVTVVAETVGATIDGFVITSGNAADATLVGGGVLADQSTLVLRSCVIRDHQSTGVFGRAGDVTFTDCRFLRNQGFLGAGARITDAGALTVNGCRFSANTSDGGSAMRLDGIGVFEMSDSEISGNTMNQFSSLSVFSTASAEITRCRFTTTSARSIRLLPRWPVRRRSAIASSPATSQPAAPRPSSTAAGARRT
ncbi:MAG: right-handed parallel beta-helix repeat-containing protein [Planctomycetes bacterium]|nr:right-handed parallel beta-helix repeat-containing protein [Planctomycetota bacterium]